MRSRIFIGGLSAAAAALCLLSACGDDASKTIPREQVSQASWTYTQEPGAIVFRWTPAAKPDFHYMRVSFTHPGTGERQWRNASATADSLRIDGLYAKYGEIDFGISFVSPDGGETPTAYTVKAQAGAVQASITADGQPRKIELTGDDLWSDAPESSEGPIAGMVDGDNGTFFHMNWHSPSDVPHWIVADLKREVTAVQIAYTCRNNANRNNPVEMTISGSAGLKDDPAEATVTNGCKVLTSREEDNGAFEIERLTGLPETQAATYESGIITNGKPFRYLWLRVDKIVNNAKFIALAELSVSEVNVKIFDPENDPTVR